MPSLDVHIVGSFMVFISQFKSYLLGKISNPLVKAAQSYPMSPVYFYHIIFIIFL